MNLETYIALSTFAFVSTITPGPNNIMLMSSGMHYGFHRTIPHILGISIGCGALILSACFGLIQLFKAYPVTYTIMNVLCAIYLLYLTYKIATSKVDLRKNTANSHPMNFIEAVLFQWINPKAWTMAITTASVYAASSSLNGIMMATTIFTLIMLPCTCVWAILGQHFAQWMTSIVRLKVFNRSMAALLLLTLITMYL